MKNRRILIGAGLILLAGVLIAVWQLVPKPEARPITTVEGYIGSEKDGLMNNPQVRRILSDRYRLAVNATSLGSIDQAKADTTGLDFLWPSSQVALELYKERHGGLAKSEFIFNSPLVFYSWDVVTDALVQAGYVELRDGAYYITDMARFAQLLTSGQLWRDTGVPSLYGKVTVISTDPTRSGSGNLFAALLASMLSGGEVADTTTIEPVLPAVKKYFDGLGYLEQGSGDLFKRFYRAGMGDKPIIVGYESQLIEFSLQNAANRAEILKRIRIIYPQPTVWSSHPLIALTPAGEELEKALQDPQIARIAWEQHGFRSGLIGIQNDPKVLNVSGVPAAITYVIPLPRTPVMARLIGYLND